MLLTCVTLCLFNMLDEGDVDAAKESMSMRDRLKAHKSKKKQNRKGLSSSPHELAVQAAKACFDVNFDVERELKNQRDRDGKGCEGVDWALAREDILCASSLFDVC